MNRRLALLSVSGALWCNVALAAAPQPRAAPTACQPTASTQAQRIRLKALLRELSTRRGFHVEYWATDDPEVVHVAGSDVEVMTALAHQANLIVRYAPAGRRCPGQWHIDTVWVLPTGPPTPAVRTPLPSAAPDTATLLYSKAHGAAR